MTKAGDCGKNSPKPPDSGKHKAGYLKSRLKHPPGRSSRREEALTFATISQQQNMEPPRVGCYNRRGVSGLRLRRMTGCAGSVQKNELLLAGPADQSDGAIWEKS